MNLFAWLSRPRIEEDVRSDGRDFFRVKIPSGEVEIYAQILTGKINRAISVDSVSWARPRPFDLTEEDKQLAIEKLCQFLRRRNRTFELD